MGVDVPENIRPRAFNADPVDLSSGNIKMRFVPLSPSTSACVMQIVRGYAHCHLL
jgi:hypothetical protein